MTKDEIEPQVIAVVAEKLSADKYKISRNTNFTSDLNADSLDLVELVMELEERFDIQIPDDQTSKILTVGNAVDFIHDQMQAQELRDSRDRLLGTIRTLSNGKLELRSTADVVKGTYDPKTNETRDARDRVVGTGNLLTTLL